jgi:hypothetical protein
LKVLAKKAIKIQNFQKEGLFCIVYLPATVRLKNRIIKIIPKTAAATITIGTTLADKMPNILSFNVPTVLEAIDNTSASAAAKT